MSNVINVASPELKGTVEFKQEFAGSHGNGEHKSLNIITRIDAREYDVRTVFQVINHGTEVLRTYNFEKAVARYNSI